MPKQEPITLDVPLSVEAKLMVVPVWDGEEQYERARDATPEDLNGLDFYKQTVLWRRFAHFAERMEMETDEGVLSTVRYVLFDYLFHDWDPEDEDVEHLAAHLRATPCPSAACPLRPKKESDA